MAPRERFAIKLAVLIGGAVLMSLEVAGFRIIGRTFGSALRETTSVIAVFLTAMSLGYFAGGRAGDRWPRSETLAGTLLLAALTLLAVPPLEQVIAASVARSSAPLATHAFILSTILFAVPTFLLAAISPIAVRLFATSTGHSGSVAGSVAALSTIGSVAGSVMTAFFLLDWIPSIDRLVLTLAITTLVLAVVVTLAAPRERVRSRLRLAAVNVLLVLIAATWLISRSVSIGAAVPVADGTKVLYERDTPYHHLLVLEHAGKYRDLWSDRAPQSRYYIGDPHERGMAYKEFSHIAKLIRPGIRRVLLIGLGGGTHAKQFLRYYPEVEVDAVDVDPAVIDIAKQFFDVRPSARLRLHVRDGRMFIKSRPDRYDLVIIDASVRTRYGVTIPPHLVTREFFDEIAAKLNDGGIVHYHLFSGRDSRFSRALYKTLASRFVSVLVFGGTEFVASNAPIHYSARDLIERSSELRKHLPQIDHHIATMGTAPRLDDVPLLTDDYAPVDSLLYGR
jgi:spermidine synthase